MTLSCYGTLEIVGAITAIIIKNKKNFLPQN